METFTITSRPEGIRTFERVKVDTFEMAFVAEPFVLKTDAGSIVVGPDTPGWDCGIFVAYDGDRKPFTVSSSTVFSEFADITDYMDAPLADGPGAADGPDTAPAADGPEITFDTVTRDAPEQTLTLGGV